MTDRPEPSLHFCEVLEQEYSAITGENPPPSPSWEFVPEQILDPERLLRRLEYERERAKNSPGSQRLKEVVARLGAPLPVPPPDDVRETLVERLNQLLNDSTLYDPERQQQFDGVRFRTHTLDHILLGSTVERNRLILEDAFPELEKLYDLRLRKIYQAFRKHELAALCLSGGGIRSATFGLGVVQELAKRDLLSEFHYLSTVSGGGYLGGWLTTWISRTNLPHVIERLSAPTGRPLEPEATPIGHLRTYSNYLSPRLAFLSADTWTLVATYLRNLFLNWLVLVPLLVGALTIPLVLESLVRWAPPPGDLLRWVQAGVGVLVAIAAMWAGVQAVRYVHDNRPVQQGLTEGTPLVDRKRDQADFLMRCLLPLVLAALGATLCWAWASPHIDTWLSPKWQAVVFAAIGGTGHLLGWSLTTGKKQLGEGLVVLLTGVLAGGVAAFLAGLAHDGLLTQQPLGPGLYTTSAMPLVLLVILVFSHLYVGYTSNGPKQSDAAREWSARYSAWLLIAGVGWMAAVGLVILGPAALERLFQYLEAKWGEGGLAAIKSILAALGTISGVATLRLGHGDETTGQGSGRSRANLGLAVAAPVFVLFLVAILAWIGRAVVGLSRGWVNGSVLPAELGTLGAVGVTLAVALSLILLGRWMAGKIDTNKFSLHAMYRARLIRAYLGASRPAGERDPNPFTGFDDNDNLPLRDLWPLPQSARGGKRGGPLHIVNAALNLVGGGNLAWQERKAESFTFSPLHCGAHEVGYRPTRGKAKCYAGQRGVSLGTAVTISGAAASPNMGYHSSPIIAFLLALFNVRLGWWLGNPGYNGREVYERSAPETSVGPLIDEALGRTDDRNPYVYLSDGGHFDNLGLYEMVLRRCHTIVVSDAGSDPKCGFEDLGNAIRKIRVDFGIPIDFTEVPIHAREGNGPAPAGKYCAVGRIRYSKVDQEAPDGTLIYLKPAYYGSEPADVVNYAKTCPTFPHETTADQFFSESQFESYRTLGSHAVAQILTESLGATSTFGKPLTRLTRLTTEYLQRPSVRAPDGLVAGPTGRGG